ncbi:MAG: hypothetical protein L6R35_000742 [Caloplaca aegaea]|nr:MAG: hypothetical protein L6R35_000742 [Caloplaca aegaea]
MLPTTSLSYPDTVRVILSLPEVKAAPQRSTRIIEMIDYIGGAACMIKLQTKHGKDHEVDKHQGRAAQPSRSPVEGFDAAGEALDERCSIRSLLSAWQPYSYCEETKRIYYSEDGLYAEEQAYFQRSIASSANRPRGRQSEDELKRAIAPFLGISQMTGKKHNTWYYSIRVEKLVAVFNNRWEFFPLQIKSTLLEIGHKLLEAAMPVLLARHPSLEHLQQVIFNNYVDTLRNGGSLPLQMSYLCRVSISYRDKNPLGLIGLFGYRSFAEAGIEMLASNAPASIRTTWAQSPDPTRVSMMTRPQRRLSGKPSFRHRPERRMETTVDGGSPNMVEFASQYGLDLKTFKAINAMQKLEHLDLLKAFALAQPPKPGTCIIIRSHVNTQFLAYLAPISRLESTALSIIPRLNSPLLGVLYLHQLIPTRVPDVQNIQGFCNIITDFALLFLPLPLVWKLWVSGKKKLGLVVVFGTGIFICAVAIVRQYVNYNTVKNGDDYYVAKLRVWLSLEFSFSIIVASLPVITPLLKKASFLASWLPQLGASSGRQNELGPWPETKQLDYERGALQHDGGGGGGGGGNQDPASSWKVPAAWKEPGERKRLGARDDDCHASDVTLQHLRADGGDQKESSYTVRAKE